MSIPEEWHMVCHVILRLLSMCCIGICISMTQERLNHCMLLHMHGGRTDVLDLVDVAKEFVSGCERTFLTITIKCVNW